MAVSYCNSAGEKLIPNSAGRALIEPLFFSALQNPVGCLPSEKVTSQRANSCLDALLCRSLCDASAHAFKVCGHSPLSACVRVRDLCNSMRGTGAEAGRKPPLAEKQEAGARGVGFPPSTARLERIWDARHAATPHGSLCFGSSAGAFNNAAQSRDERRASPTAREDGGGGGGGTRSSFRSAGLNSITSPLPPPLLPLQPPPWQV